MIPYRVCVGIKFAFYLIYSPKKDFLVRNCRSFTVLVCQRVIIRFEGGNIWKFSLVSMYCIKV